MKKFLNLIGLSAFCALMFSCSGKIVSDFSGGFVNGGIGTGTGTTTGTSGDDVDISDYDGETADDAASDIVGTDEDIYWEANDWTKTVTVTFSDGDGAAVTVSDPDILYNVSGNYVTVDMLTNSVKGVEIIASGETSDGQLKIYGAKKFKLTLSGLDLTSSKGPAVNDQCGKRAFIHLTEGTSNYITDASSYSDEPYYLASSSSSDEDRKGCLFSEGNLILSGSGSLIVTGNYRHGIATDGYFYMRPGVTVAVLGAVKNGVHAKGDEDDGIGVHIGGGLIYANLSGTAGKGIKTDYNVEIAGGKLELNTSGDAEYDSDEGDTSSASGIKADGDILISGGTLILKSTGSGGKGISADGSLTIEDGDVTVATSGNRFVYSSGKSSLTSSPKGIKAEGDLLISGGAIDVSVSGKSDGSEGIESKSALTINGGVTTVYAYDDGINAAGSITIGGGRVYSYAVNNDGIDSNGTLTINGGLVISSGTNSPEEGLDTDQSSQFKINGGTVIGTGGSQVSPNSSSSQCSVICKSISATEGKTFCILDASSEPIMTYELPRTMSNGMTLIYSGSALTSGSSYTIQTGGAVTGYTDSWQGWYDGGTWSDGSSAGSFTVSGTVTSVTASGSGSGSGGSTGPGSGGSTGPGNGSTDGPGGGRP